MSRKKKSFYKFVRFCFLGTVWVMSLISHLSTENISVHKFKTSQSRRVIEITFANGKFHNCSFPFRGLYSRKRWAVLAAIEKEIGELEIAEASLEEWKKEMEKYANIWEASKTK